MPAISQLSLAALLLSCLEIYGVSAEYVQFQANSDPLTQPNSTIAAAGAASGGSCLLLSPLRGHHRVMHGPFA